MWLSAILASSLTSDDVAGLHQLEAACHRDAFDRRDHRDVGAGDGFAGAAERREQRA